MVMRCVILQYHHFTDYVVFMSLLMLLGGIFSMSSVQLTHQGVIVKKNYLWAMIGLRWNISFDQIVTIRNRDYEIETHENSWMFGESILSILALSYFKPTVKWSTSVLTYTDKAVIREIEFKD